MKSNLIVVGAVVAATFLAIIFVFFGKVVNTFSYKVTINIEHDGHVYSGSKVWSIKAWAGTSPISLRQARWSVAGEAIPIDVGDLGRLYFLKRDTTNVSTSTFGGFVLRCPRPRDKRVSFDIIEYVRSLSTFYSPCNVTWLSPFFVAVDPSNEVITQIPIPWKIDDDCSATCLVSVVVEKTDESVSAGILDDLPWLKSYSFPTAKIGEPNQKNLSVQSAFPPYYRQDFIVENYQGAP